ncbi:insulin [Plakobranchus ocellatus]|uniref:Insulin n=1 Tax=Plakobranchus ocellatus TaxID=259542 RepID=A0AAV4A7U7_9GAST|nr:insulin [Plakobranchus ocellatus]
MTAPACGSTCLLVVLMVLLCSTLVPAFMFKCAIGQVETHPGIYACGNSKLDAMENICESLGKGRFKRDATSLTDFNKGGMFESITLKKREASNFLVKRYTRASYEYFLCECCIFNCDMHELAEYCPK